MNLRLTLLLATSAGLCSLSRAYVSGQDNYFVGIDTLTTLTSGAFAGQANPNFGKLTILYAHMYPDSGSPGAASSHYHAKSSIRLYRDTVSGPILTSDTAVTVNAQGVLTGLVNYVPETSGTKIRLGEGSGTFSGKYATGFLGNSTEWENMTFRPNAWLNRPGASLAEISTYNTSGGRYTGSLGTRTIGLRIESLSAGLEAWDVTGTTQYNVGQVISLGSGDFRSAPIFATNTSMGQGVSLNALVRIVDLSDPTVSSGTTEFRFATVPEPTSMAVLGIGAAALLRKRKRKSS
jgi:hypothetical protein